MIDIDQIKTSIKSELEQFEQRWNSLFVSDDPTLIEVYRYVSGLNGKQLRPILTLLSAKLCGEITDTTIHSALALELLHTVSLLHDDVVDEAMERRGKPSINKLWGNKVAVLAGDHLLSKGISLIGGIKQAEIINSFSTIGKSLAEGELLQLSHARNVIFDERNYFEVISKKTAILFAYCMKIGALSTENSQPEKIKNLQQFGEYLGICFQIKDDIFDYFNNRKIGKPTANDIREKKITLPLLYAYSVASEKEQKQIEKMVQKDKLKDKKIKFLISFAKEKGGIKYAEKRMFEYREKAIELLQSFDNEDVKQSLIGILDYSVYREK